MRYKYRVRLFYAAVFFMLGVILGHYISFDHGSLGLDGLSNLLPKEEIKEHAGADTSIIQDKSGIGVILPKSEVSIKNAIDLAVLDLDIERGKKLNVVYEYSECSSDDVSSALSELEKSGVSHVYGIFCDEAIKAAVEAAVKNNLVLITALPKKEIAQTFESNSIKIKASHELTRSMNRFAVAYKALYKQEPGTSDAISYDIVNMMALMMDKKEATGYEGVTGKISLDGKGKVYLISIE